jgi:hypothetical protein
LLPHWRRGRKTDARDIEHRLADPIYPEVFFDQCILKRGYGQLKQLPFWDPLRGDPRFEKIVASLAPNKAE